MFGRVRVTTLLLTGLAVVSLSGCQKTDSTDTTLKVDDFVVSTSNPATPNADGPGTGKTYRVVRGNNQPDDILEYQYHVIFSTTTTINNHATDSSVALTFPVT